MIPKISISAAFFIVVAMLISCTSEHPTSKNKSIPKKVTVIGVQLSKLQSFERVPGSVKPITSATIEAKVSGRISNLFVKEGEIVVTGQKLIVLDAQEMQARLDQAIASQKQTTADLNRFSQLLPSGAITKQEYDSAETRAQVANASVAEARTMLEYATILAPFDGVITKKLAEAGDFALPGKGLLSIEQHDRFRFEADIPETLSAGIVKGKSYEVRLSGFDVDLTTTAEEISPTTDANSRTLRVKFDLPVNSILRSGQFGYVMVPAQERSMLRLPKEAILERGQLEGVYIVRDGIALFRLIRTGRRNATETEVVAGLTDRDSVVISSEGELRDGDPVEISK